MLDSLGDTYHFSEAHTLLAAEWRGLRIPRLDVLPVFASSGPKTVTVNTCDAHPNEQARQMAATAIARVIELNMEK